MQLIDRYAYATKIRTVDPGHKAALAVLVLTLCLVLDKPAVGFLTALGMWALACLWAATPPLIFARILAAEGVFLALTAAGVALSAGAGSHPSGMWSVGLGAVWIGADAASLVTAERLVSRALGGAAAMNFLALTTPMVDLLEVARRIRLPALLCDLMTVVYRFTFTLLDSLERMHTAQESRLGYVNLRRGTASAGLLGGQLFLDAYRRSKRLETALQSRAYRGEFRVLPITYRSDPQLYYAGACLVIALLLAWSIT